MDIKFINESLSFKIIYDDGEEREIPFQSSSDFKHQFDKNIAEKYNVLFFQNEVLNKENDLYEIRFSDERNGYIFSNALLTSDELYTEDNYLICDYVRIVYYHLIKKFADYIKEEDVETITNLPLFKNDNLIFCVICKDDARKNGINTDLSNGLASLAKYGFFMLEYEKSVENGKYPLPRACHKGGIENELPGKFIRIKPTHKDIDEEQYIGQMLKNFLPQSHQPLQTFILLFQVVEHCMTLYLHEVLKAEMDSYHKGNTTKNDFGEKIRKKTSDGELIRKVLSRASINEEAKQIFENSCKALFDSAKIAYGKDDGIGALVYKFRNKIVHNYRTFADAYHQLFKETMDAFEVVIYELIEGYQPYQTDIDL